MPVNLDLGGLRTFPNRVSAFLTGPALDAMRNAVTNDIMPNLVMSLAAAVGAPVTMLGYKVRVVPEVVAGVSGIAAKYSVPVQQDEEEEAQGVQGNARYGKFPLIRAGGQLFIVSSRNPQLPAQGTVDQSYKDAFTKETVEQMAIQPLMAAFNDAKAKG